MTIYSSLEMMANVGKSGGYARTNRFEVEFNLPTGINMIGQDKMKRINMNCSSAVLPGKALLTRTDDQGGTLGREIPHSVQYGDFPVSFYLSDDKIEKKIMDAWFNLTHSSEAWGILNYYESYTSSIMFALTSRGQGDANATSFELLEAYPKDIQPVQVSYEGTDQIMILPVTFAYWKYIPKDGFDDMPERNLSASDVANSISSTKRTI